MHGLNPSGRSSMASSPSDHAGVHALSVDVEDWFQVWALTPVIRREDWDQFPLRVEGATGRLLDLFARRKAQATFFVLGWVAERCPQLIRRIVDAGHELASHGWDHTKVFDQSPEAFRLDIRRTRALLEEIGGVPVRGFRAAGFSIDQRTPYAAAILAEEGYLYSSSSHPIAHDHYGDRHATLHPHLVGETGLTELPVAVVERFGRRLSCAGGGWFRALPLGYSLTLWRQLAAEGRRGVFYLHPWEVDPEQPKVAGLPWRAKVRHRINLNRMEAKLDQMLQRYRWDRIDRVFADVLPPSSGVAA